MAGASFQSKRRSAPAKFTTSLFPKDGGYLLPIKAAARKKAGITLGRHDQRYDDDQRAIARSGLFPSPEVGRAPQLGSEAT